jgi:diacylglycerol kinase (ATP)
MVTERKVGAVLNHASGRDGVAAVEPWLRLRFGDRLEVLEVRPGVDLEAWSRSRVEAGCERILVFGGDGTFRSVASAILGSETSIGLVPVGSNNNIAAVLGLPSNPYEATEVALSGVPQWVSAGRIGEYVFFEGAGIGLEADLWPVGEAVLRRRFGEVLRAPLQLARDRAVDLSIGLDNLATPLRVHAFTLTISNTPMTGAHLRLAPGVDIRDPALFLTVYEGLGRLHLLRHLPELRRDSQRPIHRTLRYPFLRAHFEAREALNVHADGTLIGSLPVDVEAITRAVKVVYPAGADAADSTGGETR